MTEVSAMQMRVVYSCVRILAEPLAGLTAMMGKEVQANTHIAASLNDDTDFGPAIHKKVARIMKSMGLKGFMKRRRCVTTRRKPGHRVMSDKVFWPSTGGRLGDSCEIYR